MSRAEEIARIAAGLRAEARRRRLLGIARVPAAPTLPPAPAGGSGSADGRRPTPPIEDLPRPAPVPGAGGAEGAALPRDVAPACRSLESLAEAVAACRACALHATRTNTVFADGTGRARVLFVGEAPGADEDARGVPFVGRAGQLLTDIVTRGMGLRREDVAIANVLKCRPPGNRDPSAAEKATCTPFLDRQVELLDPLVIVPLGRHAANHVLGTDDLPMGRLRGRVHERGGRKVVPTYHPAYLLRSPSEKRRAWEDIQLAMRELGLPVPSARRTGARPDPPPGAGNE